MVCRILVKPMENRAAASSELERDRSNPAARAMEMGIAMPNDRTSSMCCSEEKISGAGGGVCPAE